MEQYAHSTPHSQVLILDIKQLIYEITLYIHDNYDEPMSVIDIADQALLSPSYFSLVFRVFTGYIGKNHVNKDHED